MAAAAVSRSLSLFSVRGAFTLSLFSPFNNHSSLYSLSRVALVGPHIHHPAARVTLTANPTSPTLANTYHLFTFSPSSFRSFSTDSEETQQQTPPSLRSSKLVNFSLSDESDDDDEVVASRSKTQEVDKTKLPPPYNPFDKKAAIAEPDDPKNLQEIFHKMRTEGLTDYAVKMFDALSKDGRTHEALELFGQIKDRGHMPDVVAYTAVIEAYSNAGGQSKEALKVFLRMLASGVEPNAYTYAVLIKGLAIDGRLVDAEKYVMEMMSKGMMPNAGTYAAVFEAFVREQKEQEAREFLERMKSEGFVPNEKDVRDALSNKRGPLFRSVINILFVK